MTSYAVSLLRVLATRRITVRLRVGVFHTSSSSAEPSCTALSYINGNGADPWTLGRYGTAKQGCPSTTVRVWPPRMGTQQAISSRTVCMITRHATGRFEVREEVASSQFPALWICPSTLGAGTSSTQALFPSSNIEKPPSWRASFLSNSASPFRFYQQVEIRHLTGEHRRDRSIRAPIRLSLRRFIF